MRQMKAEQVILTRLLPKTYQSTSYRAGDDGTHQAGWWKGRLLVSNKTRFISKTINGDAVVIDRATGLMFAADGNAVGCNNGAGLNWNDAIDYANNLDFAGFTDWRIPNILELMSTINFRATSPCIYTTFFPNTAATYYWTSTTVVPDTSRAWKWNYFLGGTLSVGVKSGSAYLRCVRGGL